MSKKLTLLALAALLTILPWSEGRLFTHRALADMATATATTPVLTIPKGVLAAGNSAVDVPIHFEHNMKGVAATAFSIAFDNTCLEIELSNGVLKPGVVKFNLPPQFSGSAYYEPDAPGGRIDIVIGDFAMPLATLPNLQEIAKITFQTTCLPPSGTTIVAPVTFADEPATSFSNTLGHPVTGHVVDGSVSIKRTIPNPTPTPSTTPGPDEVNTAPIAQDDSATTKIPASVRVNVLQNDMDPDGDPLSIVSVTNGGLGTTKVNADQTVTYTPDSERSGEDRFTYTISDGKGGLAAAAVWITVAPANRPPVAVDDSAATDENTPIEIDVLANDSDPDGNNELLSIAVVGSPSYGSTQKSATGKVIYAPETNFSGSDSFMYAVVDPDGGTDVATVSVTVRPVDDPPPTMIDAVDLVDISIHEIDGRLELEWWTQQESVGVAYYVYRSRSTQLQLGLMTMPYHGRWARISAKIASKGSNGGAYRFIDDTADPGVVYAYFLVALDLRDNISVFGPLSAVGPQTDNGNAGLRFPFVIRN